MGNALVADYTECRPGTMDIVIEGVMEEGDIQMLGACLVGVMAAAEGCKMLDP